MVLKKLMIYLIFGFILNTVIVNVNAAEKDNLIYLNNCPVGITEAEYKNLLKQYTADEVSKMNYSELTVLQDLDTSLVDKKTMYVYTQCFRGGRIVNKIIDEQKVDEVVNSEALNLVGSKRIALNNIHQDILTTDMKKIEMNTYSAGGNTRIVEITNTWILLPKIRSYDVLAIRFGVVDGLSVIKAGASFAVQKYDKNEIKYTSLDIDTTGSNKGKSGAGIIMNLKDDAKNTIMNSMHVVYTTSNIYSYSIYGAYEHATKDISKPSIKGYGVDGLGGVIRLKKNENVYDNTPGLSVVGVK